MDQQALNHDLQFADNGIGSKRKRLTQACDVCRRKKVCGMGEDYDMLEFVNFRIFHALRCLGDISWIVKLCSRYVITKYFKFTD
jgi:hypothetical protein